MLHLDVISMHGSAEVGHREEKTSEGDFNAKIAAAFTFVSLERLRGSQRRTECIHPRFAIMPRLEQDGDWISGALQIHTLIANTTR